MVRVIVESYKRHAGNRGDGRSARPFCPSPLLDSPYDLPQSILVEESYRILTEDVTARSESVVDEHLTDLFHRVTDSFLPELEVSYVAMTMGNIPIINTQPHEPRCAIGARTEMLHNQFGIGPLIMYLLENSPLSIMAPREVEERFMTSYYCTDDDRWNRYWGRVYNEEEGKVYRTGVYPEWCFDAKLMDIPKGVPPVLHRILTECIEHASSGYHLPLEDGTLDYHPLFYCCWYGWREPWMDKRLERMVLTNYNYAYTPDHVLDSLKSRPGDQGQGDDLTWKVYEDLWKYNENTTDQTCMPECHTLCEAEEIINKFKPFAQLIKYISHEIQYV